MDFIQNSQYYDAAKGNRSAKDLIKYVSIDIYNRIGFVEEYSNENSFMNIYEVTLTQNLVYEIIKFSKQNGPPLVGLYESRYEKTNGSDILICIELNGKYLKFPFQAKILTPYANGKDGSYKSFWHENDNGKQIDLLKKYAIDLGSFLGFYLTYNYTKGNTNLPEREPYFGCAFISTEVIESNYQYNQNVTLNGLNNTGYLKPLYKFFEDQGGSGGGPGLFGGGGKGPGEVEKFFEAFGKKLTDTELSNLRLYTSEEIFSEDSNWINLLEDSQSHDKTLKENLEVGIFNPRYKLVLVSKPTLGIKEEANEIPVENKVDVFKKNKQEPAYT